MFSSEMIMSAHIPKSLLDDKNEATFTPESDTYRLKILISLNGIRPAFLNTSRQLH